MTSVDLPVWAGALALVLAIGLRALPRLLWPSHRGTDAYYHLAYIRLIRETGHRLPRRNPRILGSGEHSYPALFHWLLSFLPPAGIRIVDRFGGLAGDAVVALGASAILLAWGVLDSGGALAVAGLYLMLPGLTLPHIGPRAFTLTPRVWAQVLYALAAGCWLLAVETPWLWWLSMVPLGLMLLLSKFAVQNLLFAAPLTALILWRDEPIATSLGGFVLALLLFRGTFVRQLVGQYGHLRWYVRHNLDMLAHRENWKAMVAALTSFDLGRLAVEALWHNPVVSGLVRHFPIVLALVLVVSTADAAQYDEVALALTLAAFVPWFVTAFGRTRVLGESERYLEFAVPAAWILLWTAMPGTGLALALAAVFVIAYGATIAFMARADRTLNDHDLQDVAAYLAPHGDAVLLCLHDPEAFFFLAETDLRLMKYNGDLTSLGDGGRFVERFFWRYPYVNPAQLGSLIEEGNVDFVLEHRRGRQRLVEASGGIDYATDALSVVRDNPSFVLYRTKRSAA